jgi:hypothetical protein
MCAHLSISGESVSVSQHKLHLMGADNHYTCNADTPDREIDKIISLLKNEIQTIQT